jgi:Domain of unknown function (DUF4437)
VSARIILLSLVLVCATSAAIAQEAPQIKPGYATEGRPGFVESYDSESLPWQRLEIDGLPSGMQARILSQDQKRGGLALVTYLPIGWKNEAKGYQNADEEIFLLEGDLTIGEQQMTKYSYAFIPAGMVRGAESTRQGAVMVQWFNQKPGFVRSEKDKPGARVHAAVLDWNFFSKPWDTATFPVYRKGPPIPGAHLKLLRRDPDTGEMTWINSNIYSTRPSNLWEVHPTFEEYFLLERSAEMVIGECLPGGAVTKRYGARGYWWRPAGIGHLGPMYQSQGYAISLVRSGGPLWADYYTDCSYKQKVDLSAPHGKP